MRTALITGITGQDGSYLAELLLHHGYTVYGLVRRASTTRTDRIAHLLRDVTLLDGDLLDASSLARALELAQPDEVYNLAAQSHVGVSFTQPVATMEYNAVAVVRLLDLIRTRAPHARFYQASTSELFGTARAPQHEATPFHPRSPYAVAKLAAHYATQNAREAYGLYACSGILFNHESPRRGEEFVTRKITRAVARIAYGMQDTLTLGNLNAKRDWGFAGDYVDAMWRMLQQDKPQDLVIATGETHSVREFVTLAFQHARIANWRKYVRIDSAYKRPAEVPHLCGDAHKARATLNWSPRVSFEALVAMMVEADLRAVHDYLHPEARWQIVSGNSANAFASLPANTSYTVVVPMTETAETEETSAS